MMPEMDGIEACLELRELPELKNVLITFLTARGEDYSQIAGFESGADGYITKPIKPRVLVSRLKALLRRKHGVVVPDEENQELKIKPEKQDLIKEGYKEEISKWNKKYKDLKKQITNG